LSDKSSFRIATPAADADVAHSASAIVSGRTGCILGLVATGSIEHLRQLHAECVGALREYIHQAEKTCELLRSIPEFPLSMEHRLAVLEQRLAENAAHDRYQLAREKLFRWSTERRAVDHEC
jgi:hypothetical protein